MSRAFAAFIREHGIQHQTSAPYTPQQTGVAERANRTLIVSEFYGEVKPIHKVGPRWSVWDPNLNAFQAMDSYMFNNKFSCT